LTDNIFDSLLAETRIYSNIQLENLALVYLGLRPCSQTILPAELPAGSMMSERLDSNFKQHMEQLRSTQDPRIKRKLIGEINKNLSKNFEDVVEASEEYRALNASAKKLNLRINQVEARPVVHEFYLYREKEVLRDLQMLMQERGKLRTEELKKPDQHKGSIQLASPEEFNGSWIRRMGSLLGYPDCCSERFALDRTSSINAEIRAATQLKELKSEPDPHVYFTSYFFPCSPTCEKALKKGLSCHDKLVQASPKAGLLYEETLMTNLERVKRQPEIISEQLRRLTGAYIVFP
jgi:hypothetical protein